MDPAALPALAGLVSAPRLSPYSAACGGNGSQAIRLYTWNVEVSAAFWGVVHVLEVAVRNAIHAQMCNRYGRADWWDDRAIKLHAVLVKQQNQAKADALYVAKKHSRSVVADDVVAALTFGFWGGLLASGGPLQFETAYWQPFLHRAFPHYVGSRADLHIDVNSLRLFRNRIAHHEPVFNRHLAADHATVVRVAGHIHPDCATYIDSHSRVPEVLARKARAVDHGYATRF